MGYGSGHGSTHGSAPVNDDEEDDSPVEEVSPVKHKKLSRRNSMKTMGFWDAVITYFKKTGSTRANHKSGTNDLDVYHKACAEYKMIYKQDFTLEHCYNVLKYHQASGGINLNDEAGEDVKETQEVPPMGRDQSKAKKKSAGSSRGGSSSFVDWVADKNAGLSRVIASHTSNYQARHKMGTLPHCGPNGLLSAEPVAILDRKIKKVNNITVKKNIKDKNCLKGKGLLQGKKIIFSVTLIASSSSKSSSTKGDVLDAGGVSSNVTLSDSSIFMVCLFRMI
nr:hypothetical protein [Tanacetum cinerariifolium]